MLFFELLRIAARALLAHRLRSFLTVVSITIGAFSIVLMTSLADSGLATIMRDVENMGGARLLIIGPNQPELMKGKEGNGPGRITRADAALLATALPHVAQRTFYTSLEDQELVTDGGKTDAIDVIAGDASVFDAFGMPVGRGRFFTDAEALRRARVCVVGSDLARDFFDGNAVGHHLTIAGVRCTVVGQTQKLARMGMNFGFSWDRFVAMPLLTVEEAAPPGTVLPELLIKTVSSDKNDIVKRIANALLLARHHGVDDFEIFDFSSILEQFQMIFLILKLIVAFVASISLMVGGVGVMNMMFVSVSERVREIGIRKALGASPQAIELQFLIEAALLSVSGGVVGIGSGIGMAFAAFAVIQSSTPAWAGRISIAAVLIAAAASLFIGIGFGVVPARRAAHLDPVDAIRR